MINQILFQMTSQKQTVLITGCSDGGLGAGLALAFHNAGLHVYATARNPAKMTELASLGIETMTLDVLSDASIADCVEKVPRLDILVNNAGAAYSMPFSDLDITEAKKLFDLNVWSYLTVTQAFLPLLLESKGIIVNHSSSGSVLTLPFQSAYNASKSAVARFSDTQRLELEPFGVKVIDLKTAAVKSNIINNQLDTKQPALPKDSIYQPAKEKIEKWLRGDDTLKEGMSAEQWGKLVVHDLLKKNPPLNIWQGNQAWLAWVASLAPLGMFDGFAKKMTGLDILEQKMRA
jgi:1-acylglycerone phosphate reductase